MKNHGILKKYFELGNVELCLKVLASKETLLDFLEDTCLVTFLRHLENLQHHHPLTTLKTLMLTVRLTQLAPYKIKTVFPFE